MIIKKIRKEEHIDININIEQKKDNEKYSKKVEEIKEQRKSVWKCLR